MATKDDNGQAQGIGPLTEYEERFILLARKHQPNWPEVLQCLADVSTVRTYTGPFLAFISGQLVPPEKVNGMWEGTSVRVGAGGEVADMLQTTAGHIPSKDYRAGSNLSGESIAGTVT